jgi:hypothetical protein
MTVIVIVAASLVYLVVGFALAVALNTKDAFERFTSVVAWPLVIAACGLFNLYALAKIEAAIRDRE